jgi:hypothetical protein
VLHQRNSITRFLHFGFLYQSAPKSYQRHPRCISYFDKFSRSTAGSRLSYFPVFQIIQTAPQWRKHPEVWPPQHLHTGDFFTFLESRLPEACTTGEFSAFPESRHSGACISGESPLFGACVTGESAFCDYSSAKVCQNMKFIRGTSNRTRRRRLIKKESNKSRDTVPLRLAG